MITYQANPVCDFTRQYSDTPMAHLITIASKTNVIRDAKGRKRPEVKKKKPS